MRRAESDTDIEAFNVKAEKHMRNGCGKSSSTEHMYPSYSKRRYMYVRCRGNDDERMRMRKNLTNTCDTYTHACVYNTRSHRIDLRKMQSFDKELASLAAPYSDRGFILLAKLHGELASAIELKRCANNINIETNERVCKCKRLFVFDKFRGHKIGRQLVDACVDGGIENGYTLMVLDTANKWHAAHATYEKKGFEQCKPYFIYNFDPDDPALKK